MREDQRGPAVCLGRADREQVLGHQRVPDPGQAGEAFLLGQRCGGRGVVAQQRDRGRGVHERRRPALGLPGRLQVQLGQQVVGDHPQSLGVGRAPDRPAGFPDRGRVAPPRLVPDQVVDLAPTGPGRGSRQTWVRWRRGLGAPSISSGASKPWNVRRSAAGRPAFHSRIRSSRSRLAGAARTRG